MWKLHRPFPCERGSTAPSVALSEPTIAQLRTLWPELPIDQGNAIPQKNGDAHHHRKSRNHTSYALSTPPWDLT